MSSYIDSISQATTTATGASSSSGTQDVSMGKEDFLMLLVAQLQNQDPLSPDDPTEFTAQLAQFSSLEQLFSLNEGMENMVNSFASSDRFATLNTIGKDVAYNDSSFTFTGTPVEIGYQLDGQASEVTLSLQKNGVTIAKIDGEELTSGNHFLSWDGQLADGQEAPSGEYKIILQAKATADESVGAAPLVKSEVTGVNLDGEDGTILITTNGDVAFNSIKGVYEPASIVSATAGNNE